MTNLRFDQNGLIPAIVQDASTGKVLTLAYMSRESLEITINEGKTCFFSRSRQELWRKGATSGNVQHVVDITVDCDGDALLLRVNPDGPACHTGQQSCFFTALSGDTQSTFSRQALWQLVCERNKAPESGANTSYLFEKGLDKILKKVGEECTEVVVAAKNGDNVELVQELSDLYYHALVLMAERGLRPDDVEGELARRSLSERTFKRK